MLRGPFHTRGGAESLLDGIPRKTVDQDGRKRRAGRVVVLGLGYVGLPTSLALLRGGADVVGVDIDTARLERIRSLEVDLSPRDRATLQDRLRTPTFDLTEDVDAVAEAEAVLICVPTPVDGANRPERRFLESAARTVVERAISGQTIIVTSTTSVGSTRELVVEPLGERGLEIGRDVHVAFSPERIDPGNHSVDTASIPRVVGGATPACTDAAAEVLRRSGAPIHKVSDPESAEFAKLLENSFRAVNISFANEMADAAESFGLDPIEIIEAASSKPFGFLPFYPGAGAGGHCIPCDPHYLLAQLEDATSPSTPVLRDAMDSISDRPFVVVSRFLDMMERRGLELEGAGVVIVGAAYKPGVADVRESPAIAIAKALIRSGVDVSYYDPLVGTLHLDDGNNLTSVDPEAAARADAALIVTIHPGHDYSWLGRVECVLDPSSRALRGDEGVPSRV